MPAGSSPAPSRTRIWLLGSNLIKAKLRSMPWAVKKKKPATPLLSDLDSSSETLLAASAGVASASVAATRMAINRRDLCIALDATDRTRGWQTVITQSGHRIFPSGLLIGLPGSTGWKAPTGRLPDRGLRPTLGRAGPSPFRPKGSH